MFILSASEVKSTLTSFMDPSSIPKQYGGELDWKWGDMPYLDEPARELLSPLETPPAEGETRPGFMKGPVLFKGDEIEILGKVDGETRRRTVPVPKKEQQGAGIEENEVPKTTNGSTYLGETEKEDLLANGDASALRDTATTVTA